MKQELLFKILVIGELGTGKTAFIKRYVHDFFSENYRATIGVDFALKVIEHGDGEEEGSRIRLQLWDIAGQERFGNMTRVYYRDAVGALLLFDVTRADSFHAVEKWKSDLDDKVCLSDGSPIPCVLLGNKCDLPKSPALLNGAGDVDAFARERGFVGWFETSAKENVNVDESVGFLIDRITENEDALSLTALRRDFDNGKIHVMRAEEADEVDYPRMPRQRRTKKNDCAC